MSKPFCILCILLISCLAAATAASAGETFTIQGRAYCDTCRAGFETSATEYLEGAKVRVECKNFTSGEITQSVEGVTDKSGTYNIEIENNHEEEICAAVLVSSPREDCNEVKAGRDHALIELSHNTGISSDIRFANSLGFLKEDPLPACGPLLQMYALADDPDDDED